MTSSDGLHVRNEAKKSKLPDRFWGMSNWVDGGIIYLKVKVENRFEKNMSFF